MDKGWFFTQTAYQANVAQTYGKLIESDLTVACGVQVSIMAAIRHPNVVLFMGVCLDPPCMVTEVRPKHQNGTFSQCCHGKTCAAPVAQSLQEMLQHSHDCTADVNPVSRVPRASCSLIFCLQVAVWADAVLRKRVYV